MPAWVEEAFQVRRPEFLLMSRFVQELGWEAQMLLFRARLMVLPLSLLGLWICRRRARALFGARAGLFSAMLSSVGPNVLGHGHLITPDLGAAAIGLAAGYVLWRWYRQPAPVRALEAGVLLGLALLTKFTWIVLVPLWPLIWFFLCRGVGMSGRARALAAGNGADGGGPCLGLAGPPCGIRLRRHDASPGGLPAQLSLVDPAGRPSPWRARQDQPVPRHMAGVSAGAASV